MITSFVNTFLSNFYRACVTYDGEEYPSVEHAYQAARTHNAAWRATIRAAGSSSMAKRLGHQISHNPTLLRQDWTLVKVGIMRDLLAQKFAPGTECARLLLKTGDEVLVEGNWWHDTFWGVCDGVGQNQLGELLMERRTLLRRQV